jgi:hypothetical protein
MTLVQKQLSDQIRQPPSAIDFLAPFSLHNADYMIRSSCSILTLNATDQFCHADASQPAQAFRAIVGQKPCTYMFEDICILGLINSEGF